LSTINRQSSEFKEGPMTVVDRVRNIMLTPKPEWQVIHGEKTGVQDVYFQYLVVVAALPAAGQLLSMWRYENFHAALRMAIASYVAALAGAFLSALVLEFLAESFSSLRSRADAFKLVAYGSTPSLIAGALFFLPNIGALAAVAGAIYTVYLFYLGLPILLSTPEEKLVPYMVFSFIAVAVAYYLLGWVLAFFLGVGFNPL
jgi:hypothetical protein